MAEAQQGICRHKAVVGVGSKANPEGGHADLRTVLTETQTSGVCYVRSVLRGGASESGREHRSASESGSKADCTFPLIWLIFRV